MTETIASARRLRGIGPAAAAHLTRIGGLLTLGLFVDPAAVTDADAELSWTEASAVRRLAAGDRRLPEKVRAAYDLRILVGR